MHSMIWPKNSVNILEINGLYLYFYFKFKMLFLIQVCVEMSLFLAALSNHESRQMFTIVICLNQHKSLS